MLLNENMFERTFRMTADSFSYLLGLLTPNIEVNRQQSANSSGEEPISPPLMLMTTLRYLAGGSYLDIRRTVGISGSSYYRVINETMFAILGLRELKIVFPDSESDREVVMNDFKAISSSGIISAEDAGDVGTGRYYSGHYACPGINVQAVCDAHCRFISVDASYPGSTNDARAFRGTGVARSLKSFPTGMYIIGDNAYPYHDSFNFHASQIRIRIEMAFGLLTTKWRVFRSPISRNLLNATTTIYTAMVLHNYVINRRIISDADYCLFDESVQPIRVSQRVQRLNDVANLMGYMSSDLVVEEGNSYMRDYIVQHLRANNTVRPQYNISRNRSVNN
ncbi:uncharacterized protein PITG_06473 [Phytophthora infestans T30-4]|uniref:DDE Tnp4 domain-containing protein n=1 Tax=Phytophthora infestans (strain T30-4) TaxID=403677 RepID=D0N4X7_PHYIT|nr:uncharacterized protein PITG_06473 [Phytophthora infestans T30-4]EEY69935.1 conserved hypothetical protein [Phytophthora infestans T30-4]|eukprot:XP_002998582.1 conserved hypothetical protein [Phytophthora infestans T30-4]